MSSACNERCFGLVRDGGWGWLFCQRIGDEDGIFLLFSLFLTWSLFNRRRIDALENDIIMNSWSEIRYYLKIKHQKKLLPRIGTNSISRMIGLRRLLAYTIFNYFYSSLVYFNINSAR